MGNNELKNSVSWAVAIVIMVIASWIGLYECIKVFQEAKIAEAAATAKYEFLKTNH